MPVSYAMPGAYVFDNAGSVTGWSAVSQWATGTAYGAAQWVRQKAAPTVGSERLFVCIVAGTSNATTEPTWVVTKGAKTTDNTVTWMECTGRPGPNGDFTNTNKWTISNIASLGDVIQDVAGTTLFICTTAGTSGSGSEPTWNKTAGSTTTDNTATWTSLGAQSGYAVWGKPHARLQNAMAVNWSVSADFIYISSTHTETQGSAMTMTGNGTTSHPCLNVCTPTSTAPPTSCTTGATLNTTSNFSITAQGFNYWYGITFNAGSGSSTANFVAANSLVTVGYFENCTIQLNNTSASSIINCNQVSVSNTCTFLNCSFLFGSTSQGFSFGGEFSIIGGSVASSGSAPAALFGFTAISNIIVRDCNLSAITGTLTKINANLSAMLTLENCKLASGVTMTSGTPNNAGGVLFRLHNCDSGSKNYRFYEGSYLATIQQETTIIRTGGASNGTQGFSWNIATSANTAFGQPYVSPEIAQWCALTTGSHTATIYLTSNASLTNGDIWMELECFDSASFPIGSVITSRVADALTSTSALSTDTSTWGGSITNKYGISVTFSPAMAGPIKVRIYVAKASTTIYVDPLIVIS